MKLKLRSLQFVMLLALLFSTACKKESPAPEDETPVATNPSDDITRNISISGSSMVADANLPASSDASVAPVVSQYDQNISYSAGSTLYLPVNVSSKSPIIGVYVQVKGASNYFDVPVSGTGTVTFPILLFSELKEGTFTLVLKYYDSNKRVSLTNEVKITITKASNCGVTRVSGGEGLTSNIFTPGEASGTIKISYNTFTVKDKIDVYQSGFWIGGTGPSTTRSSLKKALDCSQATEAKGYVGTKSEFLFPYNPLYGKNIEVVVSGCEDGGTKWEYTFSCPGSFTTTPTSTVVTTLVGKWKRSDGLGVNISGTTGALYSLSSGWQQASDLNIISMGDLKLKNIASTGNLKWSCQDLWIFTENGSPAASVWSGTGTITMASDGKSIAVTSSASYNGQSNSGTSTFYRE